MVCPNCEKEIAKNIAQCPHCGCRFPVREQPKQPVAKPIPVPVKPQENVLKNTTSNVVSGKNCPHCKQAIGATATFCKYCGVQIIVKDTSATITHESTKICSSCSKPISQTAVFCKWCGVRCA